MSRNFELMEQIERERSFRTQDSSHAISAQIHGNGRHHSGDWISDDALRLVQRIFLLHGQASPRMVVFAGIDHGNGCSRICTAVADELAKNAPGPVCLLEANLRSPSLPSFFGTTNHYGFTDALQNNGPIRSFAKPLANDKLWLISSGALTGDSPNLLTAERIRSRLAELRSEFAFVIIDTPPLAHYGDAIVLGQLSDGVVLVLEAENTRRETARAVVDGLRSSNIEILGAVLNKRTFPIPQKLYDRL
jgi:Mrp family chromosome partitioning ATPase